MYYRENGKVVENFADSYSPYADYGNSHVKPVAQHAQALPNTNFPASFLGYTGHGINAKAAALCEGYKYNKPMAMADATTTPSHHKKKHHHHEHQRKVCGTASPGLIIILILVLIILAYFLLKALKK